MDANRIDEIITIIEKAGPSNEDSRKVVLEFHGGIANLQDAGLLWGEHHRIYGIDENIITAYAAAVDQGYRIGKLDCEYSGKCENDPQKADYCPKSKL